MIRGFVVVVVVVVHRFSRVLHVGDVWWCSFSRSSIVVVVKCIFEAH